MKHTPIPPVRGRVAQIIADTLGADAAASYRPSGNCPPPTAGAHDQHMAGLIHGMAVGYAARGHKA